MGSEATKPLDTIGYVILWVRDMDRAIAFYRDVLGVPVRNANPYWSELETKGTTLALHPVASDGLPPGAVDVPEVVFNVEDVRARREALVARGADMTALKEVWSADGIVGVSCETRDPDGNRLSVHGTIPASDWSG